MQTLHGSGNLSTYSRHFSLSGIQSALGMLTPVEIKELREAVASRHMPHDLTTKLHSLSEGDFSMRHIAQTGGLLIELLESACQGEFDDLTPSDFEQILRVLAYVRKEDDAIPDFLPSGFVDDAKEVRLVEA